MTQGKKTLRYNAGDRRREMLDIISDVVRMEPVYMGFPTRAYAIRNIILEKDGTIVWDERTDSATIKVIREALKDAGFKLMKRA